MSSTALTIRYIAYGLHFAWITYALILAITFFRNKTGTGSPRAGAAAGSLSELMSTISQWTETADEYEGSPGQSKRMAEMARQIGERYGLPAEELDALECAALLHDVGQINNFDFIKEERALTFEEKNRLEEHTILGEQLVKQIANVGAAAQWVRWHHERWDGCGYPDQLSGEMIPLPVRILSVADSFDALTHKRPYRDAMSTENAMKELQKMAGIMFDPNVIQVFMSIDSESEIGSSLEV